MTHVYKSRKRARSPPCQPHEEPLVAKVERDQGGQLSEEGGATALLTCGTDTIADGKNLVLIFMDPKCKVYR